MWGLGLGFRVEDVEFRAIGFKRSGLGFGLWVS